jgi:hypothetical protein
MKNDFIKTTRTEKLMIGAEKQSSIEQKRYVRKRGKYLLWRWRLACKGAKHVIADLRLLKYNKLIENERSKEEIYSTKKYSIFNHKIEYQEKR